ncbi:hypothetical protein [Polymorphospora sp. NPDC050346]|uniref:hypothetical protein n=1 Tax=Polymorphospora sp. NPDC050346 TaxID=3155780 RepID=UPI0034014E32
MGQKVLRQIGYWHGPWAEEGWPDVRKFIASEPDAEQRRSVVAYLRSGTEFVAAAGFSLCRICGATNGSTELTDGQHFVWPAGLAHYVEAHDVRLPGDVVAVAVQGPARAVDALEFERALFETGELTIDVQWWRGLR